MISFAKQQKDVTLATIVETVFLDVEDDDVNVKLTKLHCNF